MKSRVATKEDVIERILEQREKLSSFGVTHIGLFSSFERGEQTASSDIDLLVEFTPDKHTFDNFMDVTFFLEDIMGRGVEVVTLEGLSPHIGRHILKEVERVPVAACIHPPHARRNRLYPRLGFNDGLRIFCQK